MEIRLVQSMSEIKPQDWATLAPADFPFAHYDFLKTLEESGCLGEATGWYPFYLTLWREGEIQGATYLYAKTNSYGEYIFDWQWAETYHRHGQDYYPKLTSAVPFTPATGPKLLHRPDASESDIELIAKTLIQASLELLKKIGGSGVHFLFIPESEIAFYEQAGFLLRHSYQYHWRNHAYRDFDHFLSELRHKRRKEILREREKVRATGIRIETLRGSELKAEHALIMYQFYRSTIGKMQAHPYLTKAFFQQIFAEFKEQIVLVLAFENDRCVAGALNYQMGRNLYGRYWGCSEEFKNLHFEVCYYRLIEYAITQGLELFEAGAQGEHKFQRGFLPQLTHSAHWIEDPVFRAPIARAIGQEKARIATLLLKYQEHSPFKG
jgi:predicted N-acyltransferase